MQEGNFTYVTTIFAVSDLLKLNLLQKIFKDLGFQIEKGNKKFKKYLKIHIKLDFQGSFY